MTTDENKQHVIDTWKAFATRDAAQIRKCFREDAVWIAPHNNATALALNAPSGFTSADHIAHFIANDVGQVFARDVTIDFKGVARRRQCGHRGGAAAGDALQRALLRQ